MRTNKLYWSGLMSYTECFQQPRIFLIAHSTPQLNLASSAQPKVDHALNSQLHQNGVIALKRRHEQRKDKRRDNMHKAIKENLHVGRNVCIFRLKYFVIEHFLSLFGAPWFTLGRCTSYIHMH